MRVVLDAHIPLVDATTEGRRGCLATLSVQRVRRGATRALETRQLAGALDVIPSVPLAEVYTPGASSARSHHTEHGRALGDLVVVVFVPRSNVVNDLLEGLLAQGTLGLDLRPLHETDEAELMETTVRERLVFKFTQTNRAVVVWRVRTLVRFLFGGFFGRFLRFWTLFLRHLILLSISKS